MPSVFRVETFLRETESTAQKDHAFWRYGSGFNRASYSLHEWQCEHGTTNFKEGSASFGISVKFLHGLVLFAFEEFAVSDSFDHAGNWVVIPRKVFHDGIDFCLIGKLHRSA